MRPLVCIRRWLAASVVTTALSLTVLFVCFSLDLDTTSVRSVCMHGVSVRAGRSWHLRTRRLPAILHAVALVTSPIAAFFSSLSSPDPITGMLEALVPPVHGHQPVQTRRTRVCDMYQSGYIPPLPNHTVFVPDHTFFQEINRNITPFFAIYYDI